MFVCQCVILFEITEKKNGVDLSVPLCVALSGCVYVFRAAGEDVLI